MNKYLSIIVFVFLLIHFNIISKGSGLAVNNKSINNHIVIYDTIGDIFYLEYGIPAYNNYYRISSNHKGMQFVQVGGFLYIKDTNYVDSAYYNGIYRTYHNDNDTVLNIPEMNINKKSIDDFYETRMRLFDEKLLKDEEIAYSYFFCGNSYEKYYLKIVVVKVGEFEQRVPHFATCDELKVANHEKHYQLLTLPQYFIIDILEYEILW